LPVTLVVLVTKKLTAGADGVVGELSLPHPSIPRIPTNKYRFIGSSSS